MNARKWTVIEKPWGQGYVVLVKQYKMAKRFTRFAKRKKNTQPTTSNQCKNRRNTCRRTTSAIWRISPEVSTYRYLLNVPRNRQMKAGIIYLKDFGEFYPPCPYRPQRIKSSSICKILQITLSLI